MFGSGTTSFGGFGNNTTSTAFGASTFGRPASFGTAQTTAASSPFGSNTVTGSTSLFGQNQTAGTGLFGASNATNTGFGSTSTGFGTSGGGLFGATNTTANKTGLFGSTASTGFNANQSRPFSFGTPTTSATGTTGTLFGGSLFGSSVGQQQAPGTTVKYSPLTGSDTMTKNGQSQSIQTKIEVITAMKEYESKSLEELRFEDYSVGRKGSGQGSSSFGFGQNKFISPQNNKSWMSDNSQGSGLFGQKATENKSLFGANTSTAFGTSSSGNLFGQTTTTPFGLATIAPSTGFSFGGQASQAKPAGFPFGQTTSSSSVFGQPAPVATQSGSSFGSSSFTFGAQPNTSAGLFGSSQPKPAFGTSASTNLFGNKPAASAFGSFSTSTATPFGATNTNTGTGLFGNQVKPTGFSHATNTSGFGTSATGFGTSGLFAPTSTTNKPGGLSFGTANAFSTNTPAGAFGFNQPSTGLFGSTGAAGVGLFGASANTASGSAFGTTLGTSFGSNPLQANNNISSMNSNVMNNNISNLIRALTHNPFGSSSLLKSAAAPTGKADELLNASASASSNTGCNSNKLSTTKNPIYVLPSGTHSSPKPRPIGKISNGFSDFDNNKSILFAGLEEKSESFSEDPFNPKSFPSVKKLNLKVFKNVNKCNSIDQITSIESVTNNSSAIPSPLTTPISCETPKSQSTSPSQENSPTPADIIKGRSNMKRLNIASKNHLNDTYAELGMANNKQVEIVAQDDKDVSISLFEASSVEDITETINPITVMPHPTGIKLTRAGYYTIPSMDNLVEMMNGEGTCLVDNFTVGRYGYGNICFQGVTNVANLDLDSFVFIVRKEVDVYPEGIDKPMIGDGLNKLAFVTLDCVWPVDKASHEVIKSDERLASMGWSEYLERQCLKMEASFVEYRSITGSWVFKVKHFSKYGLQDDNDGPVISVNAEATATDVPTKENIPPPSIEDMLSPIAGPNKAIFSRSSFTGVHLPLQNASNKANSGPPTLGLISPPGNFNPLEREISASQICLDGTAVDIDDREILDGGDQDEDEDFVCPLSPSAERLTITSKAPPRAIQSLKSQLFFDNFQETNDNFISKGEKRDFQDLSHQSIDQSSLFVLKGYSKKLLMGPEMQFESIDIPPVSAHMSFSEFEPSETCNHENLLEIRTPPIIESSVLREPKTEYHLLPSAQENKTKQIQQTCHLSGSIPMREGLAFAGRNSITDSAAFMGRSFRIGWGSGWSLVNAGAHLGNFHNSPDIKGVEENTISAPYLFLPAPAAPIKMNSSSHKISQRYTIFNEKLHLNSGIECPSSINMLNECLSNVLEVCESPEIDNRNSSILYCPYFRAKKGIDLLHRLALTATQIEDFENSDRKMSTIFDLCSALWGKLQFYSSEADGDSEYAQASARKEALSQWLEEVSEAIVTEETEKALAEEESESYLDAIFSHMTARQISEACNLAQDKNDHHMALLLSQTCLGDETPRQIMNQQLSNWAWAEIDSFISTRRLFVYTLLGGKATHDASHIKINICEGLDWKRALALHLWYICPTTSTIAEVLKLYEKAAGLTSSDDAVYCQEPKPSYLNNESLPDNLKVNHDVCFQLLKLYVDPSHSLESLLETSSITPDPMDISTSWFLWCILQSLGYSNLSPSKTDSLHTNMAALLESQNMWQWAAFVILSLPNENKRRMVLSDLLNRHLLVEGEEGKDDPFYSEKEHFLLQYLRLPEEWLHRAKAIRAKSLNLIDEEAWYLVRSGQYNKAHNLIVEKIAPDAVINEDHEHLKSFLKEFDDEQVLNRVSDWSTGGGIYKNYLDVIQQVEEMKKSRQPTGVKIERLRPRLLALCTRLNNLNCHTAIHRLCVSEMSRMVVSVLRAILSDEPEGIRVLAQQISVLPLAHESALEELNLITHQYLTQVSMKSP